MRKMILFAAISLALGGCITDGTPEPKIETETVKVPVAVKCDPKLGAEPAYPDTSAALVAVPHPGAVIRLTQNAADLSALSDEMENLDYQLKLLLSGRLMRIQRDAEKSAAIAGCASVPN